MSNRGRTTSPELFANPTPSKAKFFNISHPMAPQPTWRGGESMDFNKEASLDCVSWTLYAQNNDEQDPHHENPELVQLQTRRLADAGSESVVTIAPREEFIRRQRLKWPDDLNGIEIKLNTRRKGQEVASTLSEYTVPRARG